MRSNLKEYRDFYLSVQSILAQSLQEKDKRIWDLEEEIRSLRDVVSELHIDSSFWMGRLIGLSDDPHQGRRKNISQQIGTVK